MATKHEINALAACVVSAGTGVVGYFIGLYFSAPLIGAGMYAPLIGAIIGATWLFWLPVILWLCNKLFSNKLIDRWWDYWLVASPEKKP